MNTFTVWLLIAFGSNGGSPATLGHFPSAEACETVRAEAVAKIGGFYKAQSACIKATIVAEGLR